MRTRPIVSFAAILVLALVVIANSSLASVLALPERSWSRTLTVIAGDTQTVAGGIDFASDIQVSGTINVQSCCGLSTDDIAFSIGGGDYPGRSFGVITGVFRFEWNSGQNDRYEFIFDNEWIVCGGTPFTCARNETSPSYHDKTVELMVTEVAPFAPYLFTVLQLWSPVIGLASAVTIVLVVIFLRKRKVKQNGDRGIAANRTSETASD